MKYILILLLFSTITLADIPGDCPDDMVSYWRFEEGSGSTASDSFDSNPGTLFNMEPADWQSGQVGGALRFDAGGDKVEVPDSSNLDITDEITMEFWLYIDSFPPSYSTTVTSKGDLGGVWAEVRNDGRIIFWITTNNTVLGWMGQFYPDTDVWNHYVATYSPVTGGKLYVNGTLEDSHAANGVPLANSYPYRFGAASKPAGTTWRSYPFYGLMDEIAIYNRTLTQTEAQLHYENGLAGLDYCDVSGGSPGYAIPEFSTVGLLMIAAMFVLLMVVRKKKT